MIDDILSETKEKMGKAVEHTLAEFGGVRTGRASPAFVEKLAIDYYGSEVAVQQIAGSPVPEARMLVIHPYNKGETKAIEKANHPTALGVTPSTPGEVTRLPSPPLT